MLGREFGKVLKLQLAAHHCFETAPGSASAWIRIGEIKAHDLECAKYNKAAFKKVLQEIRELTKEEIDSSVSKLITLCASCGVAVVLVKEMKKVPWNGATKWINPDKAMILLSLRGKGEDKFWFSFFHEAGHVLHDSKKGLYIADGDEDKYEKEADKFAAETIGVAYSS